MTSVKNTGLLLGLILSQLINITTAATLAPIQESLKQNVTTADSNSLINAVKSTDNVITPMTTFPPNQESSNQNLSAANLFSVILEDKFSENGISSPSSTESSQEALNQNFTETDLFSIIIGGKSTDKVIDSPSTSAPLLQESSDLFADDLLSIIFGSKHSEIAVPSTTIAPPQISPKHNLFAADLFDVIVKGKSNENIVYSPASIQTCMALAFIGAEDKTAEEMREVLRLGEGDKKQVAERFREFLKTILKEENGTEKVPKLKMANRIYVNDQLKISPEFQKIAQEYFETQAEPMDFSDNKVSVEKINRWIEHHTESKIRDLLKENSVNEDTNAVLVNAIYFKGKWLNPFSQSSTSTSKFHLNLNDSMEAEIMYNEEYYNYADLPELEASALEMPYENSDISMLIILPNDVEGLENLESKLRGMDLNDISSKMSLKNVHAYVPKFRIEFDIDLKEPLKKMGLKTTFTSDANFKGLFTTPEYQSISEVKHKAFLDVNEAGSEAAAATFASLTTLSAIFDEPIFRADHPFIFAIRSKSVVYFAGHVAKI